MVCGGDEAMDECFVESKNARFSRIVYCESHTTTLNWWTLTV